MINVTNKFRQALFDDKRDYLEYVDITLANGTKLNLTNEHLWDGGIEIEDATSSDSSFDIGSAIINSCQITINNIYDDFADYDFGGAKVFVQVGLQFDDGTIEKVPKGTFIVDEATYNGAIISLSCLDNMSKFDKPYSESKLAYPATLGEIARNVCSVCGVTFSANSLNFPHKNYSIAVRPDDESTTCREVLSYVAQIAGCFARCNASGELELKWYDQESFEIWQEGYDGGEFDSAKPYATGDSLNGGTFNPWNTGAVADGGVFTGNNQIHYISGLYQSSISVDDVVITGVKITVKLDDEDKSSKDFTSGSTGYEVAISDNPMITEANGQEIVNWLGAQLVGLTFRKATVSHSSDPTIEAGDIAVIWDRKSNGYPIFVTRTNFKVGGSQTTVCGAETPARNSSTRYSLQTKNNVELRKKLEKQKTTHDQEMEELGKRLDNANGLYATEVTTDNGGNITYLHNKPNPRVDEGIFEFPSESDIILMFSDVGIQVTNEGNIGGEKPSDRRWYGIGVDGTVIANILNTIGINADWIRSGAITITDEKGNETFYANAQTGVVRINASLFKLTGNSIQDMIDSSMSELDQETIFNILTNDGSEQGIYLSNGKLYLNFKYAVGQTLKLGGKNNSNGTLYIYDASDAQIGVWNNTGLSLSKGSISGTNISLGGDSNKNGSINIYGSDNTRRAQYHNSGITANMDFNVFTNNGYNFKIATGTGSAQIKSNAANNRIEITQDLNVYMNIKCSTLTQSSDRRKKDRIDQISNKYIDAIGGVEIKQFELIDEETHALHFGVIAQDIEESLRESQISETELAIVVRPQNDDEFLGVQYNDFILARIAYDEKIIQEQKQEIDNLNQQVNELQSKLDKVLALLEI